MIPVVDTPLAWTHPDSMLEREARAAALRHGYELGQLLQPGRRRNIAKARHHVWADLRDRGFSLTEIADVFGVHHSSVRYGSNVTREGRVFNG